MGNCKPVSTPMEPGKKFYELSDDEDPVNEQEYQKIIGRLTYATPATRSDQASAVSILAKHMSRPGQEHWQGVKRILRYVQGTVDYGLMIFRAKDNTCSLTGCLDAYWAVASDLQ